MKFIRVSSYIIIFLLALNYFFSWYLIPHLMSRVPALASPIGTAIISTTYPEATQFVIKYSIITPIILVLASLTLYVINFVLRLKFQQWDRWFLFTTILFLPAVPFIIAMIVILPKLLLL